MVAPKNISTKDKPDDKKSNSPSPEPFREPEGMTTIDLNKSDDYSEESELEKAKRKKNAQVKYLAQLLFALGSILVVVLLVIMMTFLNTEYHILTMAPSKISLSHPPETHVLTPSPTDEFLNITEILNKEKFRETLKSGRYIQQFSLEMDLCRLFKAIEFCCDIFRYSDLQELSEFCTVDDMLKYLIENEINSIENRELYEESDEKSSDDLILNNLHILNHNKNTNSGISNSNNNIRKKRQVNYDSSYGPQSYDYEYLNPPEEFMLRPRLMDPYNDFNPYQSSKGHNQYLVAPYVPNQEDEKFTVNTAHIPVTVRPLTINKKYHFPEDMISEIERAHHDYIYQNLENNQEKSQYLEAPQVKNQKEEKSTVTIENMQKVRPLTLNKEYQYRENLVFGNEQSHHNPDLYLEAPHVPIQEEQKPTFTTENTPVTVLPLTINKKYQFPDNVISEIERSHHDHDQYLEAAHVRNQGKHKTIVSTENTPVTGRPPNVNKKYQFPEDMIPKVERLHHDSTFQNFENSRHTSHPYNPEAIEQFLNFDVDNLASELNANIALKTQHHEPLLSNHNIDGSDSARRDENSFRSMNSKLNGNTQMRTHDIAILPTKLHSIMMPFLPERVRENILHHVTIAPKQEHIYKSTDFQQDNHFNEGYLENNEYEGFEIDDQGRLSKHDRMPKTDYRLKVDANGKFHVENNRHLFNNKEDEVKNIYRDRVVEDHAIKDNSGKTNKDMGESKIPTRITSEHLGSTLDLEGNNTNSQIKIPPNLMVKNKKSDLALGSVAKSDFKYNVSSLSVEDSKANGSQEKDPKLLGSLSDLDGNNTSTQIKIPPNLMVKNKKTDITLGSAVTEDFNTGYKDSYFNATGGRIFKNTNRTNKNLFIPSKNAQNLLIINQEGTKELEIIRENKDLNNQENSAGTENQVTQNMSQGPLKVANVATGPTISPFSEQQITTTKVELEVTTDKIIHLSPNHNKLLFTENHGDNGEVDESIYENRNTNIAETLNRNLQTEPEANIRQETTIFPNNNTRSGTRDNDTSDNDLLRSNNAQDIFSGKQKQDSFTASEDMQTHQQSYINPCYNPYMSPYIPFMPPAMPPVKVGSAQEPGFLKVVSVSSPHVQNQPMYVLNPSMFYGVPPPSQPVYPSLTQNPFLPQMVQAPYGGSYTSPVQVTSAGGQYYVCNPIPTPTNNIAGISGVEVRRHASNLQSLMENIENVGTNNNSREATLICPLGETACLDNIKCIKNHHVCDGEVHCEDSSDEIACTCKDRVGKLRQCDGYCDCPTCKDEQGCFGCEEDEYSCDDWSRFRRSTCVPISQRCDGIKQCEVTGKDEMDCSILTDHIGNFPLSKVSNAVGFLHRNYKGKWYPTCFGTELWAAQVCQVEAGPSAIIPKAHMTLTTDPYKGLFINILPNNKISLVNTCVQDRATFVECPPIYCGLRFLVNNPYRAHEVDVSIEDMLNDLERAYKLKEDEIMRSNIDSEVDLGRIKKESTLSFVYSDLDGHVNRSLSEDDFNEDKLKLEEVVESLERTFRRREISKDDEISEILKQSRVVGGKSSQPAAWPWLVSIYKNGIFHCGGVLINELWIITASHCVDRYWQYYYEIQAGALRRFSYSPMDQRRWATVIVPHEFYSKSNLRNDIALMKLSAPLRYNKYVRPICLPSETTAGQHFLKGPSPGTVCTTVGWGATVEHGADPDHMREVEVPILQHCKHQEDSDIEEVCAGLTDGGKDACQGDSGGPLMCRNPNNPNQWYLAGIVSHGEGCARPNEPGVYTKVSRYVAWIAENTREDKFTVIVPLPKCPGYVCKGTKRCIPKKRHCDRIVDCLLGDDEMNCETNFRQLFKHSRKSININNPIQRFTTEVIPNVETFEEFGIVGSKPNDTTGEEGQQSSITKTKNETEEEITTTKESVGNEIIDGETQEKTKFQDVYFKCKVMLQVVSINYRCNKIIDCEDGTDEVNCTCADYIKNVDPTAICDGVSDCFDLSDEKDCNTCNKTEYTCRLAKQCIGMSKRCDGNADCPHNEDEDNCATLTNGRTLTMDRDDRPMFKSRGIVTINHLGQWKPLCLNATSPSVNDEPSLATVICNLLGFDEYFSYHKYLVENGTINVTYSLRSGRILPELETKKCNNCCEGLYISCSNTSISTTLHYMSLEQAKELYVSPWTAAIYSNGHYKCTGTLLDQYWIVTSDSCFRGITILQGKYLVAVFGRGKLNLSVKGPHEQIIRIVESIIVNETDIVLLRLEQDVKFNRYVQAASLNVRRDVHHIEKCYAIGEDNHNQVKFVSLSPLKNCLVGFKCFEKKIEEHCHDIHSWSGTIICDSRSGWYPAAVYKEETGHCGFHHEKKYTSVKFYKNEISAIMTQPASPVPPPPCEGLQCNLGNCIPKEKICDGVVDCHSGEDEKKSLCYEKEKECYTADNCVCPQTHLKCPTTYKCFPKSSFCDRVNNCGEFEDEPDVCSCRNYLKLTDPGKICDGVLNCMDRSDEDPTICTCRLDDFACGKTSKCVPQDMVCDGVDDCPNGEDEASCLSLNTDNHGRTNAGEAMTRTAGIWHTGCFDLSYSALQLEEICYNLGFSGGSATQLSPPHNITTLKTFRPVLDTFDVVWLRRQPGNKLKLRIRTGNDPYVKFVPDKRCHRLFIACI